MVTSEFASMLAEDERHWWYRGRRRVLRSVLDALPLPAAARVLDAGCGSGRTLDELRAYGDVCGVDLSADAVASTRRRGHDVLEGPVEALPFASQAFDLVTCLDVVEHTPDDRVTLRELRRVARPGGHIVVTVPAHPLLWSAHDELNMHYRRYTRRSLKAATRDAGLELVRETYFNGILLAPATAVRFAQRRRPVSAGSDLERTPAVLNRLLELPLAAEARVIARGGRVPAGLSLLFVLRRPALAPAAAHRPAGVRPATRHDAAAQPAQRIPARAA
jgi:SAM-dependent methyltransferase